MKDREKLKQKIALIISDEISSEVNFKVSDTWEAAERILKVVEEEK